jgi:predicted nucleic acid-binding protein
VKDVVVDSSVVAKWILPESDSPQAQRIVTTDIPEIVLLRNLP